MKITKNQLTEMVKQILKEENITNSVGYDLDNHPNSPTRDYKEPKTYLDNCNSCNNTGKWFEITKGEEEGEYVDSTHPLYGNLEYGIFIDCDECGGVGGVEREYVDDESRFEYNPEDREDTFESKQPSKKLTEQKATLNHLMETICGVKQVLK